MSALKIHFYFVLSTSFFGSQGTPTLLSFFFLNNRAPPEFSPFPLPAALRIPGPGGGVRILYRRIEVRQDELARARLAGELARLLGREVSVEGHGGGQRALCQQQVGPRRDRKSTRLNSSHT